MYIGRLDWDAMGDPTFVRLKKSATGIEVRAFEIDWSGGMFAIVTPHPERSRGSGVQQVKLITINIELMGG